MLRGKTEMVAGVKAIISAWEEEAGLAAGQGKAGSLRQALWCWSGGALDGCLVVWYCSRLTASSPESCC